MNGPLDWKTDVVMVLLGTLILLLGYHLVMQLFTSEEDRIRDLLGAIANETEKRKPLSVTSHFTHDFILVPEGLSRESVRRLLFGYFHQTKGEISVVLRGVEVDLRGDRATAAFKVGIARGGALAAELRPDTAFAFRVILVKVDGEWKIERAEKEPAEW